MNHRLIFRLVIDFLLFVFVMQGWWFVAVPLGLVGAWSYAYFVELLIAGMWYDALFGLVPDMGVRGYIGVACACAVLIVISIFKKVVRR